MLRSSLIAAGVGLLCSSALAQNVRTALPITSQIKDGGTLDWATGTWHRNTGSIANAPGASVIYENTCTWSGAAFYAGNGTCWDQWEEGRLPTGDPADPFSATITANGDINQVCDCYFLCGFQFGYCTLENPTVGSVQFQFGFTEGPNASGIGGDCMNGFAAALATPVPPYGAPSGNPKPDFALGQFPGTGPNDLYFDIAGLPGTQSPAGNAGCWVITLDLSNNANGGFTFCGDGGDASYQNDGTDYFNWLFGMRGTTELGTGATGMFISGAPFQPGTGPGTGALGIPQGIDPLDGVTPCGSGLDSTDHSWINVDGAGNGSTNLANACTSVLNAPLPAGSNCYFFGGAPANPFGDAWMVMWASGCETDDTDLGGGGGDITNYCAAKASSSGCLATLGGTNNGPIVSGANNWSVVMTGAQGNRPGIFFGSNTAQAAIAFQGGTLCVQPPTKRSVTLFTFGTNNMCDGGFSLMVNTGVFFPPPLPGFFDAGPGGTSFMQAWYRDPALMDGFDTALSDGLQIDWM